jgi:hypothetical protein
VAIETLAQTDWHTVHHVRHQQDVETYLMIVETVGRQYRFQEGWGKAGQQLVYGTRDSFQHRQGLGRGRVTLQQAG